MISGYDRDRAGTPEAPVGPRVRLYELAKDLGLQPKDLVAKVRAMAIDVANHMSQIEPADVDRIRRAVDRERHESLVEERLTVDGTVIRRRSKVVAAARPRPRARSSAPRRPLRASRRPRRARAPAGRAATARPRARAGRRRQGRADADTGAGAGSRRRPSRSALRRRSRRPRRRLPPQKRRRPPPRPRRSPRKPIEVPVPQPLSRAGLRTIPQPVVTGSAATGAFIQLPGLAPRGDDANAPRVEIKDRDEELRRLGRSNLLNRAPAGRDRFGRPSFGPGGQRPGSFPKKRVAAAGKKLKQTQITTPAEHKRVVRMGDTIAVAELAKKMAVQGREIVKKLWALGMMGVTINQDIDLDTATLIANEFGFQIESTAFNEEEVLTDTETAGQPGGRRPPRAGRHHHGARRPRQDLAARRDPQGERRRPARRAASPSTSAPTRWRARRGTSCSSIRRATRRSPPCARAAPR